MRSLEERFAEAKRRIAANHRQKLLRRNRAIAAFCTAACLALLIGACFAMPGMAARMQPGDFSGLETAASMYGASASAGYLIIALLAFLLGVCVTVLCFRLQRLNREDEQDRESEDAHGAG